MRAYKGFNKDMTCRGFQFEESKTYEEKEAKLCEKGFHACLNPIDVFKYYPPVDSIYHSTATSGDYSHTATSGDYSPAATSGDYSPAATSGDSSHAATSGYSSIAAAIGRNSKAKSTIGNWIVLAEYGEWNGKTYPVLCVKCGKIDGVSLKPDTWYCLKDGEFVEEMSEF